MATHRQRRDSEEWRMCSALDHLSDFERYDQDVLPILQRAVSESWPSTRIRKELASFSQALVVQQGLAGNVNRSSQIAAIRDVLDREEGKAVKQQTSTHLYAKMTKAELAALVYQKLVDAGLITGNTDDQCAIGAVKQERPGPK